MVKKEEILNISKGTIKVEDLTLVDNTERLVKDEKE